jgi:hypothetical protein
MPTPVYDEPNYTDDMYKDDNKLFVMFYPEAVKNEVKTAAEGRPIFDTRDMIRVITPGSKDIMVNKATMNYQQRFPKQWERYKKNQEQTPDGTPLDQVPFLTVSQIAELRALNVMSLEGLAGMADTVAHRFMGFHDMRTKAQKYLDAAKSAAPITALQAQVDALKSQNEVLQHQLGELMKVKDSESKAKVDK